MTVPTKLRRELSSSPSTLNLADFLEVIEAEGYDDTEIQGKVSALETAVGDATGGIVKDIADINTEIGDAEGGIVKDIADINTAIGDPTDPAEGTILARLYALEHPTVENNDNAGQE